MYPTLVISAFDDEKRIIKTVDRLQLESSLSLPKEDMKDTIWVTLEIHDGHKG